MNNIKLYNGSEKKIGRVYNLGGTLPPYKYPALVIQQK